MKLAIVEPHHFHREMFLTLVPQLEALGAEITIYATPDDMGFDDFLGKICSRPISRACPSRIYDECHNFDKLIFTTFPCLHPGGWEACGCFKRILALPGQKILITHLPEQMLPLGEILARDRSVYVFYVSAHGHRWFDAKSTTRIERAATYLPVFKCPDLSNGIKSDLCISGEISYNRRDYRGMFSRLRAIAAANPVRLAIVGRVFGDRLDRLNADITDYGLASLVSVFPNAQADLFYSTIQSSNWVVTALQSSKERYFTNALTGAVNSAISAGTPLIMERELAGLYSSIPCLLELERFDDPAFVYQESTVEQRAQVRALRQNLWFENLETLQTALLS